MTIQGMNRGLRATTYFSTWGLFACLALLSGCDRSGSPEEETPQIPAHSAENLDPAFLASLPEDTAFVIEDQPITKAEIDAWIDIYGQIEPGKSIHHQRRMALTNQMFPIAVGKVLDPEGRASAQSRIERVREKIISGQELSPEDPQVEKLHDSWNSKMGLDRWGMGQKTTLGEWSEVFETLGGFTMVRVIGAPDPWLPNSEIMLDHVTVSYIPPEQSKEIVGEAIKAVKIYVVDPEWARYLPTLYLYQSRLPESQ